MIVPMIFISLFLSWGRLASIYHGNSSFFNFFFVAIYPIEEIIFLFAYYLIPINRDLWVSLIVILICFTLVVDKSLLVKQFTRALSVTRRMGIDRDEEINIAEEKYKEKAAALEKDNLDLINYSEYLLLEIKKMDTKLRRVSKKK